MHAKKHAPSLHYTENGRYNHKESLAFWIIIKLIWKAIQFSFVGKLKPYQEHELIDESSHLHYVWALWLNINDMVLNKAKSFFLEYWRGFRPCRDRFIKIKVHNLQKQKKRWVTY